MAPSIPDSDPAGGARPNPQPEAFGRIAPVRWPGAVRTPDSPGFEQSAKAWLFDLAPARWRYEEALHKHPVELASMIRLHLEAEITAVQARLRTLRETLGPRRPPLAPALDTSGVYAREQAWARAMLDQVKLIEDALTVAYVSAKRRRRSPTGARRRELPYPRPAIE